jgi:hypothetical protein
MYSLNVTTIAGRCQPAIMTMMAIWIFLLAEGCLKTYPVFPEKVLFCGMMAVYLQM